MKQIIQLTGLFSLAQFVQLRSIQQAMKKAAGLIKWIRYL
jgi:hypothetical protein